MERILFFNEQLMFDIFPDGEAVIYDDQNEITHILNETALMAYNACVGFTLQQAEENFLRNFDFSDKIFRSEEDRTANDKNEKTQHAEQMVSKDEILTDFRYIVEDFLEKDILLFGGT